MFTAILLVCFICIINCHKMNTDHFIALYDMENYIWTMIMASWTPLIIHDSYELQTSMISDHSKWGFIRFTRSMITHDCYEHWLWAITVHRNSYEFGFWTINDQTHHTWWGGINAMKCWCSYMINTDSVSYYDPYLISPPSVVFASKTMFLSFRSLFFK